MVGTKFTSSWGQGSKSNSSWGCVYVQVHQRLEGGSKFTSSWGVAACASPPPPTSIHLTTTSPHQQAAGIAQGAGWVHPGPGAKAGQGAMLLLHQRVKGWAQDQAALWTSVKILQRPALLHEQWRARRQSLDGVSLPYSFPRPLVDPQHLADPLLLPGWALKPPIPHVCRAGKAQSQLAARASSGPRGPDQW